MRIIKKIAKRVCSFFNFTIKVGDFSIPILGGMGYSNLSNTERWMNNILGILKEVSEGCFLDVGVNVGQTLIKVKAIDRNWEYIGFEPNPACIFYVDKLIEINQFSNCTLIPAGIADITNIETLKRFSNDIYDSSATILDNFRPDQPIFNIRNVIVLNSELIKIESRIGIMKIDVEGAELLVIRGLKNFIERDRPVIIIEILPVYNKENQVRLLRQNSILEQMKTIGYSILKIIKNKDGSLKSFMQINDLGIHADLSHCDYVFTPDEKLNNILALES